MARVGAPAPDFKCMALKGKDFGEISLGDYKGKYLVLFFYPLDFTFVCPTEILEFSKRAKDFHETGCEVLGASVDSHFCHLAWVNTPRADGGLGGALDIPLLADLTKKVSADYGALLGDSGLTMRALYVIDDKGIVRHITMNDPPVGRNVDEILRIVKGYQYTDKHGEVCPVNWTPGAATMVPDPEKSKAYFSQHA
eukprot:CAMPEP_0177655720 /NCGR_PEP_ID=MMETSP0447-20121125/15138_1 /TAXON_ID=0 /ORGANISM="Stygamoeba regulata, Strain BSH-02190019" /LENGTH=195 /DNA_ID=CAMNT_0019159699 /DNA_START=31 /DNA_END=618 /DNA_ORIENTATION=-